MIFAATAIDFHNFASKNKELYWNVKLPVWTFLAAAAKGAELTEVPFDAFEQDPGKKVIQSILN